MLGRPRVRNIFDRQAVATFLVHLSQLDSPLDESEHHWYEPVNKHAKQVPARALERVLALRESALDASAQSAARVDPDGERV